MENTKDVKKVMFGCWGLGKFQTSSLNMIYINEGPFKKFRFPSSEDIQRDPYHWLLPPLARFTSDGIDFMPFILYDNVVIDRLAFDCLLGYQKSVDFWKPSRRSIKILESLAEDEIIELRDYTIELDYPDVWELLDIMTLLDLVNPTMIQAAKKSLSLWMTFYKEVIGISDKEAFNYNLWLKDIEKVDTEAIFKYIFASSADINRILYLSNKFGIPIYDWESYLPFYRSKFYNKDEITKKSQPSDTINTLFNLFLPDFQITSYEQLIEIRNDSRLNSVRDLVDQLDNHELNKDIVIQAQEDVLRAQKDVETFSKYTGIIGLALNFLPGPVGDIFQLSANYFYKKWREKNVQWQTFFVERAIQFKAKDVKQVLSNLSVR